MSAHEELAHYELTGLENVADAAPDTPPGIEIRSAVEPADLSNIADVYNAAFERVENKVTAAHVAGYARHAGMMANGVFLAFEGAVAAGVVVGRLDVPAPGGQTRRAGVELLMVRPEYRRREIAAALLGALLTWLAAMGVEVVGATVDTADREMGVETLLERYGFRQVGVETG